MPQWRCCPGPGIVHTLPVLQGRHEISNNSQHNTPLQSTPHHQIFKFYSYSVSTYRTVLEIRFDSPQLRPSLLSVSQQFSSAAAMLCTKWEVGYLNDTELRLRDVTLLGKLYLYFVIMIRSSSTTQQLGADITNNLRFQSYCGLKPELSISIMITSFYIAAFLLFSSV